MGRVWLVRHAPAAAGGVCYGQSDIPLTLEPAAAAHVILERWTELHGTRLPELWTSPWARTERVAARLAEAWRTSYRADPRLSELSFGAWEGRRFDEIERTDGARFERWMAAYDVEAPPSGETVPELRARVREWLEERRESGALVLAVTHAGVIRTARALIRGVPYRELVGEAVTHLQPESISARA